MTDPRMTPTNDAPVTVERLRAQLQAKIRAGFCAEDTEDGDVNFCGECHWCMHILSEHRLAALASALVSKLDRDFAASRIKELMDEGDGFWRACSGCQEGVDGYVSEKDYPFDPLFRCQPGGGCRECGGIGVLWDDGRGYEDITGDEEPASAPAGDGELAGIIACMDEMLADPKLDALAFDKHDSRIIRAALARPRAAVGEREAGLRHAVSEAKRALRLVQGCMECNADDERRWAETIEWLERLA